MPKEVAIALKSSFDNSLQEGLNSLEAGKFQTALKIFKSLEREGSITPDLLEGIGRAYMMMGATEEAIDYFRKAIKTNPNLLTSKINLGISLIDRSEFTEGVKLLKEVLDNGKSTGKLSQKTRARLVTEHVKLGEIYVELDLSMEAIQEYKKAIRIGGDYPDIRRKMAREYIQMNLLVDAERELKKALQRNPFYEEARADLGFLYMLKGRADLAKEEWSQVKSGGRGGGLIRAYRGGSREASGKEVVEVGSLDITGESVDDE
jgi:tetratricopeptide (TPR) repeat protein